MDDLMIKGGMSIRQPATFDKVEWCFQFDNDEPIVFARANDDNTKELTITLKNNDWQTMTFYGANGKQLKLFARQKQ